MTDAMGPWTGELWSDPKHGIVGWLRDGYGWQVNLRGQTIERDGKKVVVVTGKLGDAPGWRDSTQQKTAVDGPRRFHGE